MQIGKQYECTARGKLKTEEIKPVVGDNVEIEKISENQAVISTILERVSFMKRPKVSNISQIIFVVSCKLPKPNFLMLDKQLALAEFLKMKSIIVINKIDLDENEADRIYNLYKKLGYEVFKTDSIEGNGIDELKKVLKNNTSAFARTVRCTENQLLQIKS